MTKEERNTNAEIEYRVMPLSVQLHTMDFQNTKVWSLFFFFPFYIEITLQCCVSFLFSRRKIKYAENNYKQNSF